MLMVNTLTSVVGEEFTKSYSTIGCVSGSAIYYLTVICDFQQRTSSISRSVHITCCPVVITELNSSGIQRMLLRQYIIPYVHLNPFFFPLRVSSS